MTVTPRSCAFSVITGLFRVRCAPTIISNVKCRGTVLNGRWNCSSAATISAAAKEHKVPTTTTADDSPMFHGEATFSSLGMSAEICEKLESVGITQPTNVQVAVVPRLLAGLERQHEYAKKMRQAREEYATSEMGEGGLPTLVDESFVPPTLHEEDVDDVLIVGAETGSGKTLAYLLPFIEALKRDPESTTKAVVLLPTRELCAQTASFLHTHVPDTPRTLVLSGGKPPDVSDMPGVKIFIATPTSLMTHMGFSEDGLRSDKYIVVDEADMLLTGSFLDDVARALNSPSMKPFATRRNTRARRHNRNRLVFVGATYPHWVGERVKSVVTWIRARYPQVKEVSTEEIHRRSGRLQSTWKYVKDEVEREESLNEILKDATSKGEKIMVFASKASRVEHLYEIIGDKYGVKSVELHKNMIPRDRAKSLEMFASDEAKVMFCTDVASRGLDLGRVTRIIEYDFATNVVAHLHRIGRTARAGAYGRTDSLYDEVSKPLADAIRKRDENDENVVDGIFSRNRSFRRKLKKSYRTAIEQANNNE